jgi:hypothetical protein
VVVAAANTHLRSRRVKRCEGVRDCCCLACDLLSALSWGSHQARACTREGCVAHARLLLLDGWFDSSCSSGCALLLVSLQATTVAGAYGYRLTELMIAVTVVHDLAPMVLPNQDDHDMVRVCSCVRRACVGCGPTPHSRGVASWLCCLPACSRQHKRLRRLRPRHVLDIGRRRLETHHR